MSKNKITAGIIVIGDEILKGITKDENACYASKQFFNIGIHLIKISTIGDDIDQISNEVNSFSKSFTYVLTSGGIGPTHDDITYKGIANAFNQPIELNQEFVKFLNHYKPEYCIDSPYYKMAQIPQTSILHFSPKKNKFPLVQLQNVYILPGIPHLFRKAFDIFKEIITKEHQDGLPKFYFDSVILPETYEVSIANTLTGLYEKYSNDESLKIGSYPEFLNGKYGLRLTIFSTNKKIFDQVYSEIKSSFQKERSNESSGLLNVIFSKSFDKFDTLPNIPKTLTSKMNQTIFVFEEVLKNYKFPSEISIAFNGGKDCCAMLHMWLSFLSNKNLINCPTTSPSPLPQTSSTSILLSLYIRRQLPFPEVEEFIFECSKKYNLNLVIIEGSFKKALIEFKALYPQVKAILMGTRKSDPNANGLRHFTPTDEGWPLFMRIHPILDWTYNEVWQFNELAHIPYCCLYDRGYTSLGNMDDTFPNSKLKYINTNGMIAYKSAKELDDEDLERHGRRHKNHI